LAIAEEMPELVVDERLRLRLAFDGGYDWRSRMHRAVYAFMRQCALGRQMLKAVPLVKILLNRHCVRLPHTGIGSSTCLRISSRSAESADTGRQTHRYRTPVHEITLSACPASVDAYELSAAEAGIAVKTLAGDVHVKQVRIDLDGAYEVLSIHGRKRIDVSCGGNRYSISILNDMVDGIIRDKGQLAIDISLSSNWNFFGGYEVGLRIARRAP
jgi:hypothetical protein